MEEVEENTIIEANSICCSMGNPDNSFSKILKQAENYRNMGVTPIFIWDKENQILYVKIKETYKKNLN